MADLLNQILKNARKGNGACNNCPAHETLGGRLVNPGLGNPNGELAFITDEPSHETDWSRYDSWSEYNEDWFERFKSFDGGRFISDLVEPTPLTLNDVWVGDSIKCPTQKDASKEIPSADTGDAAVHCRPYLREEIEYVDPEGIVTLGRGATLRTLQALDVPYDDARRVRVTKEYGLSEFDTEYPVVISLHWAQRSVKESEWIPVVKEAIADIG